jgi:RNA polymerase sigma factor for flagellar operon FliA
MSRHDLEALFLANLPATERILSALARRYALPSDAAEEFSAWTKLRLIENDYAILAKFRGESSLPTYLTVVLTMLFREYRVREWGRWRPSAAALRGGSLAIRLETLVNRDGMPVVEAGQLLRTSGETTLSDRELAGIASQFPMRTPLRPVQAIEPPKEIAGSARAEELVESTEAAAEASAAKRALDHALEALPLEDRLIVRMHYLESMSIADIARGLKLPQKPLYRRLERALSVLRAGLERAGISREHVRELATGPP